MSLFMDNHHHQPHPMLSCQMLFEGRTSGICPQCVTNLPEGDNLDYPGWNGEVKHYV
ncbi:MAG: hypothetical protein H7A37_10000 [Chlamydiales bacterium]|nr:hypothetical protein [Chlamydiia bacterium]MCP5508608.1 hypothetical protein [Chlamydiales bacterium]